MADGFGEPLIAGAITMFVTGIIIMVILQKAGKKTEA
jgi:hypothetical protein